MTRQEGDLCPHCKKGRLTVDPDRMEYESPDGGSGSHRTGVCDNPDCGKRTRDHTRGVVEPSIGVSDDISVSKGNRRTVSDGVGVSDSIGNTRDTVEPKYSVFFNKKDKRVVIHRIGYCIHIETPEDPKALVSAGVWGFFADKSSTREFAEIIGKSKQVPVSDCKDCKSQPPRVCKEALV